LVPLVGYRSMLPPSKAACAAGDAPKSTLCTSVRIVCLDLKAVGIVRHRLVLAAWATQLSMPANDSSQQEFILSLIHVRALFVISSLPRRANQG
jgi:hypothetical protein